MHVVERIVVHTDEKQLDHEGALQEPEHQDQGRAEVDVEEPVEDPRIDREVDGNDPRIDERGASVVLPIDPKLPVADADLRADGKHVLRQNPRREKGDQLANLRWKEAARYRTS